MRKFTATDYRTTPWKNGGGTTTQLAAWPEGAGLDAFDWRISSAQVAAAGPFSLFPGVDRSLTVLQGHGLKLDFDGTRAVTLTCADQPLTFRGEQQVYAALLDGPITDFNVMTRRSRCTHTLDVLRLHGALRYTRQADLMFIYCDHGANICCRTAEGPMHDCAAGDAVLVDRDDGDHVYLSSASSATLYIAHITCKGKPNAQ